MEKTAPFRWGGEPGDAIFDGKFYQSHARAESARRRELILGAVALDQVNELGLDDYQKWVELDWKEPHYSVEAFKRFETGLLGEIIELDQEIDSERQEELLGNWKSREKLERASEESISELGDVLWYGTAMLSNARIDAELCIREYLHNKWEPVEWDESFSIGDVQRRIHNHTPYPFPRKSVSKLFLEDVDSEREIARDLFYSGYTLAALMSRVFNKEKVTIDPRRFLQESGIEPIGGLFVAYVGYHAEKTLGSSLEEVIAKNVEKISCRVEQNHLDKADGERSPEEI